MILSKISKSIQILSKHHNPQQKYNIGFNLLLVADDDFDDEDDIPMPLELFNIRRQERIRDYYQVNTGT